MRPPTDQRSGDPVPIVQKSAARRHREIQRGAAELQLVVALSQTAGVRLPLICASPFVMMKATIDGR